jgi:geranylgeranyl pyrophosphate synthase
LSSLFAKRIFEYTNRIVVKLEEALPDSSLPPRRLHQAMRYSVLNGGKRIRPLLVYATGECLKLDVNYLDAPAIAIELIHAFSLIHDDLPSMDNDDIRRGYPTVHRQFDEATAILAADALQPLAFQVLATAPGINDDKLIYLIQTIAKACGSLGMTGGQSIDLSSEGQKMNKMELEQMYALKTGALIEASVTSVLFLADDLPVDHQEALQHFSSSIGIAFQIKDDILDVEGKTNVIGKKAGADQRLEKATYPSLFGIEVAKQRCKTLLETSLKKLEIFGDDAEALRWLTHYIVERNN